MPTGKEGLHQEDEISLKEIYNILKRGKLTIFLVTATFVIFGILYSFLKTEQYDYQACLSLGISGYTNRGQPIFFDSPDDAIARISSGIIPSLISATQKSAPKLLLRPIDFKVEHAKGSSVICVSNDAAHKKADIIQHIENTTLNTVVLLDQKLAQVQLAGLQTQIQSIKTNNAALTNQQQEIKTNISSSEQKLKLMNAKRTVISSQVATLDSQINKLSSLSTKSIVTAKDSTQALAGMMQGNQIVQLQNQLYNMKMQEVSNIPQEKITLSDALKNDQLKLTNIDQQIALNNARMGQVNASIQAQQTTKIIHASSPSGYPVGPGKLVIIVLSLFLGLILSVFIVLIRNAVNPINRET